MAEHERQVRGKGRYGIASGGLDGDGDVWLLGTPENVRKKAVSWFSKMLQSNGKLVKGQWLTPEQAETLHEGTMTDIESWQGLTDGDVVEISVVIPNLTVLRVAMFKCWYGPRPGAEKWETNQWTIPPTIRLAHGASRVVTLPERKKQ